MKNPNSPNRDNTTTREYEEYLDKLPPDDELITRELFLLDQLRDGLTEELSLLNQLTDSLTEINQRLDKINKMCEGKNE